MTFKKLTEASKTKYTEKDFAWDEKAMVAEYKAAVLDYMNGASLDDALKDIKALLKAGGETIIMGKGPVRESASTKITKSELKELIREALKEELAKKSLKEALTPATLRALKDPSVINSYRTVLADYDTDDFDINVEFGVQDPDENEVVDYEYLLKPGQRPGDLVVWLSRDCGYTSIYVHDGGPATPNEIKRLASHTFPVSGTDDEWTYYGEIDW